MGSRLDAAHSIVHRTGIPSGWRESRVGELVSIIGGGTPKRQQGAYWRDGAIPWITPSDISANRSKYIGRGEENISELGLQDSNATLVPQNSTVLSTRGTVGNMVLTRNPLACNQSCEVLVPRSGKVDAQFLFYLLAFGRSALIRLSGGTTFGSITRRDIANVRFALPSQVEEQAIIARILDAVDTAIEHTGEAIGHARQLHRSILHDLLERGLGPYRSNDRHHPRHWHTVRVDEVATVSSGVTLGKDVSGRKSVELPYLRVANVQDGHLDLTVVKTVRIPKEQVQKYCLEAGDVLMTEGGDIDKLGRGTIWEGQIPVCLHQNHIFRIRPNRVLLEPSFYALVVESDIAKRYFSRVAKRTTNLASTNKTQVRAFQFFIPPTVTEQREIVDILASPKSMLAELLRKESTLRKLKSSLLHDLLTGTVRVGDKSEASAS